MNLSTMLERAIEEDRRYHIVDLLRQGKVSEAAEVAGIVLTKDQQEMVDMLDYRYKWRALWPYHGEGCDVEELQQQLEEAGP